VIATGLVASRGEKGQLINQELFLQRLAGTGMMS
jgi:hypothetical protein